MRDAAAATVLLVEAPASLVAGETFNVGSDLNNVRIQKAQQLLKTGCNVTECTERCGFESISYFISLFRKTLGCTPGQYMKKNGLISED